MKTILILVVCLLLPTMKANAAGECPDEVFLRRAYLTVTGTLPSPQTCVKFLDNDDPDKRKKLIKLL